MKPQPERKTIAQGGHSGRSCSGHPGSAFPRVSTLSPNTFSRLGERTKREIRNSATNVPFSVPLAPNRRKRAIRGERKKPVETMTQSVLGAPAPRTALGYISTASTGLSEETAPLSRCASVQVPNLQTLIQMRM